MIPPLHTTQAVFPAEPDKSLLGHQAPAHDERAGLSARNERKSKERRSKPSQDSESGSSRSDSESEDDSWTRWEGVSGQSMPSTSSYRHLDTLGGCHEYHISGFSLAHGLGPGVRLCSDYFEVAGQLWRLEVYPAGVSVEAANHLSLFLTTPGSTATSNQVLHKIVIVDQSGKGHHITKSRSRVHGPLLASRGIVAAYPKAVKLSHLMSHAKHYLLHDTLLVRAKVQIVRSWSYDAPPAVTYQPEQYQEAHQPGLTSSGFRGHGRPEMQQW
ncbi:hypothetical protein WJX77_000747 [Trebouxia sp. C0004]